MKRALVSNVSAAVLSMLVGLAILSLDQSFAVADNTNNNANTNAQANDNSPNANSTRKPGENCDKLNAATQEFKDCIKAQAETQKKPKKEKDKKTGTTGN